MEHARAVVDDAAGLAVHQPAGAADDAAEGVADRLVAEADAEQRQAAFAGQADHRQRDAGLGGRGRPRRDEDVRRTLVDHLLRGHLVIAVDADPGAQFLEVLHQVEGEGVIVVDDGQHAAAD